MGRWERRARWRGIIYQESWSRFMAQTGTKGGHWYRLMPRTGTNVHFQQPKGRETATIGTDLWQEPVPIHTFSTGLWHQPVRPMRCRWAVRWEFSPGWCNKPVPKVLQYRLVPPTGSNSQKLVPPR